MCERNGREFHALAPVSQVVEGRLAPSGTRLTLGTVIDMNGLTYDA